ncbi:hypothetical protein CcrC1_gp358 [Caulobacter phage C1]|nr:hypothetical protein CcrC1_gp358 [Caulobacter phage C1]UTU08587.1 hypothetical protein CcrC2_gp359 [Caulobacter phage C2]UTU09103.1 hypothetical protein CcrJ4_gp354 [Caulobacter phage J4]UTU09661.1 hypothetical protein CcrBL47_gp376 [Caulobacter phage BL47]UTU10220.1 hypothetical protein CcrRB23_gp358 [Caulobacter phage RB23]WGN97254.1 hypothetical protein [Bertelyvirus sp.]
MSITVTTTTISYRYFARKTRDWLANHIQTLHDMLDQPRPDHNALMAKDKATLVREAMNLHAKLPDDE